MTQKGTDFIGLPRILSYAKPVIPRPVRRLVVGIRTPPAVDPHAPSPERERQRVCCCVNSHYGPYRTQLLKVKEVLKPLVSNGSFAHFSRKSRNHRFLAAFFAYFLSLLTKSMPSETKRKNCWEKYATGGASAIRNTVVSAGFQPLWGVKTGTLPRNRLAFSATGGASAIILAFSRRCAILNPSHIQRQSRDLRVAPMGA